MGTQDVLERSTPCSLYAHVVEFGSTLEATWVFGGGGLEAGDLSMLAQPAELVASGGEVTACAEEEREEWVDGVGAEEEGGW